MRSIRTAKTPETHRRASPAREPALIAGCFISTSKKLSKNRGLTPISGNFYGKEIIRTAQGGNFAPLQELGLKDGLFCLLHQKFLKSGSDLGFRKCFWEHHGSWCKSGFACFDLARLRQELA